MRAEWSCKLGGSSGTWLRSASIRKGHAPLERFCVECQRCSCRKAPCAGSAILHARGHRSRGAWASHFSVADRREGHVPSCRSQEGPRISAVIRRGCQAPGQAPLLQIVGRVTCPAADRRGSQAPVPQSSEPEKVPSPQSAGVDGRLPRRRALGWADASPSAKRQSGNALLRNISG